MDNAKKIMIIAGEASGDLHGSALIHELKKLNPGIQFSGIGGDNMIEAGFDTQYHIKDMAFLGFVEVIKHLPFIKKVQRSLLERIEQEKIDAVILIDYPGFNLNIAPKIKELGAKVIYYISPQLWAWGKKRIKKVKRDVDKMIVVFPFEETMYRKEGIDVEYIGHPLIERINDYDFLSKEELYAKHDIPAEKEILLVMPGSRKQEIERIYPKLLPQVKKISDKFNLQTVIACSQNLDEAIFKHEAGTKDIVIVKNKTYDLLKHAKFGIIKSGTSTLEAAIFGLPFVAVYYTSPLTFMIGKRLIQVNNIAMPNIIAGKTIVDEIIQNDLDSGLLYEKSEKILSSREEYDTLKEALNEVKIKLGGAGASRKGANAVLKLLNEK